MTYADRLYDAWADWIRSEEPGATSVEDAVRRDDHSTGFYLAVGIWAVRDAPPEPLPADLTDEALWETCDACRLYRRHVEEHNDGDAYRTSAGLYRSDLCSDHRNRRAGHRMRAEGVHASVVSYVLRRMLVAAGLDGEDIQVCGRAVLDGALDRTPETT